MLCKLFICLRSWCDGKKRKVRAGKGSERDVGKEESREEARMSVSGKARTLAILSLGSLTAAVIAVGNLLLFSNWLTRPIKISHPRHADNLSVYCAS